MNRRAWLTACAACGATAAGAAAYVHLKTQAPSAAFLENRTPIRLTYDVELNAHFRDAVAAALRKVEVGLTGKLLLPLSHDAMVDPAGERRAIVHLAVLRNGDVHAIYSNWTAGFSRPISFGSISKVMGLLALAQSQPHLLNAPWCRRSAFGFRNADGHRGFASCNPRALFDAEACFAASDNLATLAAFRHLDQAKFGTVLRDTGVGNVPTDYMPAIAAAFGHLELSPLQAAEMFHALGTGQARRCAITQGALAQPSKLARWTAEVMSEPTRASRVRQILAAPVFHALGTARHLRGELAGASMVCAKTGTAVNAQGHVIAKALALTFTQSSVPWTALALITSPRPSMPLGNELPTSAFAPIHRALLAVTRSP